jgi:hypothetical protein
MLGLQFIIPDRIECPRHITRQTYFPQNISDLLVQRYRRGRRFQPRTCQILPVELFKRQSCGAEPISFGSGSTETQIRILAPAPDSFIRYLENYLFDLQ